MAETVCLTVIRNVFPPCIPIFLAKTYSMFSHINFPLLVSTILGSTFSSIFLEISRMLIFYLSYLFESVISYSWYMLVPESSSWSNLPHREHYSLISILLLWSLNVFLVIVLRSLLFSVTFTNLLCMLVPESFSHLTEITLKSYFIYSFVLTVSTRVSNVYVITGLTHIL